MKRLIIITEGPTEKRFVDMVLAPFLYKKGIYSVSATSIKKKGEKGGFVNYQHLKNHLKNFLDSEKDIVITTLIDFFRIPNTVPKYNEVGSFNQVDDRISHLEQAMQEDINDERFIAYIQKHEFEALLFSSNEGFEFQFDNAKMISQLKEIINEFINPEEINSRPEYSPSNRIINILKSYGIKYDKPEDGETISLVVGIDAMIERCPRFKAWIERILQTMLS